MPSSASTSRVRACTTAAREVLAPSASRSSTTTSTPASARVPGLALCRYVLRLPPVVAMTPPQLIADIAPTLQRYLTSTQPAA
ncbi:hypothetical protein [Nocardia lijiangensis]|uniref:TetR/AcrR family transcriptional regulator n=1 Tax=Nocardia lijiangensis TaxID=299618 RepID=UPI001FDFE8CA